jgi:hypothetical protein
LVNEIILYLYEFSMSMHYLIWKMYVWKCMENWKNKSSSTINFTLQYNVSRLKLRVQTDRHWIPFTLIDQYAPWEGSQAFWLKLFLVFCWDKTKKIIIATYSCILWLPIFSIFLRSNLLLYRLSLWYNTYISYYWIARKSPQEPSMCVALYCWHGYFLL